ncbi:uncharacterized protein LOC106090372 [Stomoxys calcitrans]|uniref:Uncharacterized protein n=1 Tax=Stomoxys calcitrans TaxID=35570 RepID=A0A1I8NR25_STOCA|nr:uncharacterized protein LOC106090372 [Stomoxys calcitrans]
MKLLRNCQIQVLILNFCIGIVISQYGQHTWEYELVSIDHYTSDADLLLFYELNATRVSRGVYACAGTIFFNYDVVEGDSNEIEIKTYRSDSINGDYKPIPFTLQRQHIFGFMNDFYKNALMETLKDCSNLPLFDGDFVPPLEKRNYTMDNCVFTQKGFPQHLQDGYYKVVLYTFGDVEWSMIFYLLVQNIFR